MDMIEEIESRLLELKRKDKRFSIFGASNHKYRFNPRLSDDQICLFEQRYEITLPKGYRTFLTEIGNGGAGPYYGLETLEDSVFQDLDYKRPGETLNLKKPFPFTESWNMEYKGSPDDENAYQIHEDEYFSENGPQVF